MFLWLDGMCGRLLDSWFVRHNSDLLFIPRNKLLLLLLVMLFLSDHLRVCVLKCMSFELEHAPYLRQLLQSRTVWLHFAMFFVCMKLLQHLFGMLLVQELTCTLLPLCLSTTYPIVPRRRTVSRSSCAHVQRPRLRRLQLRLVLHL
jgi:hypothetical protein